MVYKISAIVMPSKAKSRKQQESYLLSYHKVCRILYGRDLKPHLRNCNHSDPKSGDFVSSTTIPKKIIKT